MRDLKIGLRQVGNDLGDLPRVRGSVARPVHGFFESPGGDEFHRPRDLTDILDGF
jgi:hypothetical protein